MGEFRFEGSRIHYDSYGSGDRVLVLCHGLLMNGRMYERMAPEIAACGNRVLCIDVLGHGRSDRPDDLRRYSMARFADQIAALLDHLHLDQAVVGGTSLGANAALEFAARHGERARGLFIEMPVLENALTGVAVAFTPVMLGLRFGRIPLKGVAAVTRLIPRTNHLLDIGLDWIRQDPEPSLAVLHGLLLSRICPPSDERVGFEQPALVIGHPSDPVHPFSDADMLVDEMPNSRLVDANSILEWRLRPGRLNEELAGFLDEVWEPRVVSRRRGAA